VTATRTLGEHLDEQARRMAARLLPTFAWAGPLSVVSQRAARTAAVGRGRFDRVDGTPDADAHTAARPRRAPTAPARPGGAATRASASTSSPSGAGGAVRSGGEARQLPADLRGRLRPIAGAGADALRVRDDDAADVVARAHGADAVTIGTDVHFRRGSFRPRDDDGFALLAHEARHVLALLEPGAAWRRATAAGRAAEESEALTAERRALYGEFQEPTAGLARHGAPAGPTGLVLPRVMARPAVAPGTAPAASRSADVAVAPAGHPMPAAAGRAVEPAAAAAAVDIAALRRELMDEILRRVRGESERGA